ncbi:hypothetical protein SPI_06351 [Niveomyces insectorum RCEF 264]|uniref:Uncharacterized protein n=1 Tax=Niveomyces insectorum RCEF 264 TaxID=1081102 RepID=A0A167S1T1_9HYPO|nr:hypothetical protein SPI_06351 [Niveomyces insectorum RCEF 264]
MGCGSSRLDDRGYVRENYLATRRYNAGANDRRYDGDNYQGRRGGLLFGGGRTARGSAARRRRMGAGSAAATAGA